MSETLKIMTDDDFQQIFSDDHILNGVAHAHGCNSSSNEHLYFKAFGHYPTAYKVTEDQISKAKAQLQKRKTQLLNENKDSLIFVAMGMNYKNPLNDGVNNHRIRAQFVNKFGVVCFIEFGTTYQKGKENFLRIDHAYKDYKDDSFKDAQNYRDLERNPPQVDYTYANVLKIVNEYFDCHFTKIFLAEHFISTQDTKNDCRFRVTA